MLAVARGERTFEETAYNGGLSAWGPWWKEDDGGEWGAEKLVGPAGYDERQCKVGSGV